MPVLHRRELAASVLTGLLVTLYLVFLAAGHFLGLRDMSAVTLLLTGPIIVLLTDDDQPPAVSWFTTLLAVPAVVSATLSLAVSPSVLLLTVSIATTSALWSVHLAEHLTFTSSEEARDDHHGSATAARRRRNGAPGAIPP